MQYPQSPFIASSSSNLLRPLSQSQSSTSSATSSSPSTSHSLYYATTEYVQQALERNRNIVALSMQILLLFHDENRHYYQRQQKLPHNSQSNDEQKHTNPSRIIAPSPIPIINTAPTSSAAFQTRSMPSLASQRSQRKHYLEESTEDFNDSSSEYFSSEEEEGFDQSYVGGVPCNQSLSHKPPPTVYLNKNTHSTHRYSEDDLAVNVRNTSSSLPKDHPTKKPDGALTVRLTRAATLRMQYQAQKKAKNKVDLPNVSLKSYIENLNHISVPTPTLTNLQTTNDNTVANSSPSTFAPHLPGSKMNSSISSEQSHRRIITSKQTNSTTKTKSESRRQNAASAVAEELRALGYTVD